MTASEEKKIDSIARDVGDIKIAVAVLAEKTSHAVDETTVVRIVKGALGEHLVSCRAIASLDGNTLQIKGINPALVKALILVATAVAGALGGSQIL